MMYCNKLDNQSLCKQTDGRTDDQMDKRTDGSTVRDREKQTVTVYDINLHSNVVNGSIENWPNI